MPRRKLIYLDQNRWIELSRAFHGRPGGERFTRVVELALQCSSRNVLAFPLSGHHYRETWKDRNYERRKRLALVMSLVSKFETLARESVVLSKELRDSMRQQFG